MQTGVRIFIAGSALIAVAAFVMTFQNGTDKPVTHPEGEVATPLEFAGAPQSMRKLPIPPQDLTGSKRDEWAAQEASAGTEELNAERFYITRNEAEGNAAYERAVRIRSKSPWWQSELPITLNAWAKHYRSSDPIKAERLLLEALEIQDKLPDTNPVRIQAHLELCNFYKQLGMVVKARAQEQELTRLEAATKLDAQRIKAVAD